jgi:hypothetical protein
LGHTSFTVKGHPFNSVFVVEIAPTTETWQHGYVGFPLKSIPRLNPQLAVGPAGGAIPQESTAYSGAFEVETASSGDIAVFSVLNSVPKGHALYVRCTDSNPLTDFCFGSKQGERYQVGDGSAFFVTVQEWIERAAPSPPVSIPIEFHSDAARSFDVRAISLVEKLSDTRPHEVPLPDRRSFGVDLHIPDHVVVEGTMREESPVMDGRGFKAISDRLGRVTLAGDAYIEFRRLCQKIRDTRALRNTVSSAFISDHLFDWLVAQRREEHTSQSWCAGLKDQLSESVALREVWVPLHHVFVEIDFPIGSTSCRTMTANWFATTVDAMLARAVSDEERAVVRTYVDRLRRSHQGHAAIVLSVFAEHERAAELALEAAQTSTDILRLYDPAVFRPEEVSSCLPYGRQVESQEAAFVTNNGRLDRALKAQTYPPTFFKISRRNLSDFMRLGLGRWHDALVRQPRSDLEDAALASVVLFTRGATKRDLSDRIMYTFAAIESLLLKDAQEPLAQNIGDRLALAVENSTDNRINAVRLVKEVYGIRSQFVHHGAAPKEVELVGRLLELVWKFYTAALPSALARFSRRLDYVEYLDRLKYSA